MTCCTPLSNKQCRDLLRSWGFDEVGGNGGHLVMARDGHRVQIAAPGRRASTPHVALRKAAKIAGVSYQAFLVGP